MKKIAIVYWSGTGNTAQMAEAVAEGAGAAGAQANLFTPSDFSPAQVKDYDAIAFGCPAMGAEQLEDFEFEPLFLQCAPELNGMVCLPASKLDCICFCRVRLRGERCPACSSPFISTVHTCGNAALPNLCSREQRVYFPALAAA